MASPPRPPRTATPAGPHSGLFCGPYARVYSCRQIVSQDSVRISRRQIQCKLFYIPPGRHTYPCHEMGYSLAPGVKRRLSTDQGSNREYQIDHNRVNQRARCCYRWRCGRRCREVIGRHIASLSGKGNNPCQSDRHYEPFHLRSPLVLKDASLLVSETPCY